MEGWTAGDVSGAQSLIANDHLRATHLNELRRVAGRAGHSVTVAPVGTPADYNTDGTADNVQIQAAIDEVGVAGGGSVYLLKGTYYLAATLTVPYSNIAIVGAGPGITHLQLNPHVNAHGVVAGANNLTYYENQTFKDFSLDGDIDNQDQNIGSQIYVESIGLILYGVSNASIENVTSSNWCKYGITIAHPDGGDSSRASHNRIINCRAYGSYFDEIVTNFSNYNLIDGCSVSEASHAGIYIKGGNGNVCVGNEASGNSVGLLGQYTDNLVMNSNQAIDNRLGGSGISLFEVGYSTCIGNTVQNTSFDGIRLNAVHHSVIMGNVANDSGQSVGSTRVGIHLLKLSGGDDVASSTPEKNLIAFNHCGNTVGGGTKQNQGIQLSADTQNNEIRNNFLFNNNTAAVDDQGTANIVKDNNGHNGVGFYAAGNSGTAITIDRVNGDHQAVTMTGNCTFTITAGKSKGDLLVLELTQDATGSRTATWPANFKKAGGSLTLTTTAGRTDMITARWDGTNWVEVSRSLNVS